MKSRAWLGTGAVRIWPAVWGTEREKERAETQHTEKVSKKKKIYRNKGIKNTESSNNIVFDRRKPVPHVINMQITP